VLDLRDHSLESENVDERDDPIAVRLTHERGVAFVGQKQPETLTTVVWNSISRSEEFLLAAQLYPNASAETGWRGDEKWPEAGKSGF
jgi:hypothetical protein